MTLVLRMGTSQNTTSIFVTGSSAGSIIYRAVKGAFITAVKTGFPACQLVRIYVSRCVALLSKSDIHVLLNCAYRCAARLAPDQFQEHAKRSPLKLSNPKSWGAVVFEKQRAALSRHGTVDDRNATPLSSD
jgi:hypothetical protein